MTIDLHGYNVEEATAVLLNAIFSFKLSKDWKLEIITGKGENVMMMTALDILEDENLNYKVYSGRIIVYKHDNVDFEF